MKSRLSIASYFSSYASCFPALSGRLLATLCGCLLLCGCGKSETDDLVPGSGSNIPGGEPVAFSISLGDTPGYNAAESGTPATTRNSEPLLSEWVKVNTFSSTRAAEATGNHPLALMELYEDAVSNASTASSASPVSTVSPASPANAPQTTVSTVSTYNTPQTRGVMPAGYTLRVIAFWKNSDNYEYQSVADYTSNGNATPSLVRGEMSLSVGQTYRFAAYSFNNSVDMGVPLSEYTWNGTSIAIPDLKNDFMTYDSGDQVISSEAFTLPVSFKQQLCKLTVQIAVTGFPGKDTFSHCTEVYVKQGGTSSSWTVGAAEIAANTNNTPAFGIPDNSTVTVRIVPFAQARPLTVHIGTLTVGYNRSANNTDISSSQSVKLQGGKTYTMTVRFKSKSIHVPEGEIDLGGTECTSTDKTRLSKLLWAEGNLMQQEPSVPWAHAVMTDSTQLYGHYYVWKSEFGGEGVLTSNKTDPCTKLDASQYGSGWRTPTYDEFTSLSHCASKSNPLDILYGKNGMWFMNKTTGLFLPAAGFRYNYEGGGTTPAYRPGTLVYYWSSGASGSYGGSALYFSTGTATVYDINNRTSGFPVRCVKDFS